VDHSGSVATPSYRQRVTSFVDVLQAPRIDVESRLLAEQLPSWNPLNVKPTPCHWPSLENLMPLDVPLIVISDFVPSAQTDLDTFLRIRIAKGGRPQPIHTVLANEAQSDTRCAALLQSPRMPPWFLNDAGGLLALLERAS
jgi:hypothetical protein